MWPPECQTSSYTKIFRVERKPAAFSAHYSCLRTAPHPLLTLAETRFPLGLCRTTIPCRIQQIQLKRRPDRRLNSPAGSPPAAILICYSEIAENSLLWECGQMDFCTIFAAKTCFAPKSNF